MYIKSAQAAEFAVVALIAYFALLGIGVLAHAPNVVSAPDVIYAPTVMQQSQLSSVQLYDCLTYPNSTVCPSSNYRLWIQYCASNPSSSFCGGAGSSSTGSKTSTGTVVTTVTTTIVAPSSSAASTGGLSQYGGYSNTQYCGSQYSGTNYCNSCQSNPSSCSSFNYAAYVSYCNNDPANTYCGGSGSYTSTNSGTGMTAYGGYSATQYCGSQYSGTKYCQICQGTPSACTNFNYAAYVNYCNQNPSYGYCGGSGVSTTSSNSVSGGLTQYGGYSATQYCGSQYSGTNYCNSCQSSPSSCSSFNYAAYVNYCNNDPTNKYCGGSGSSPSTTSNTPSNTVVGGGLTQYGGYSATQYCGSQYSGTNYCNSCQTSPSACSGFNYAAYVNYCNKDPTNVYCGGSGSSSSGSGSSISITVPSTNSNNNQQTGTTGDNFATTCNVNGQLSQYCSPYLSYQFDQFCGGGINSVYCNTQGALGFARYQYRNVCQAYPNLKYCQSYQGSGLLFNYCAYNNDQNNAYYTQCNNYLNSQSYPYDKLCYSSPGSYYCNPSGTQGFQDWQYAQYCGSNPSSQFCQTYVSRSSNPYYQYTFCQNNPNSSACSTSTPQGQQQQLSTQYIQFCQGSSSQWCLPTPTAQGFQYYEYSLYCQGNPNSQFCQGYLDPSGYAGCAQTTQYCQTYLQSESYQYAQYCSQFGSSDYCAPFMSQQGYQLYMQNLHCQSDSESQYCTQFSYAGQQQYQYCSAYQGSNYCIACQANPNSCAQWPFSKYYAFCANDPTNKYCLPA
ncbi:MAG TPA: hypothetical protein VNF06_00775 [Candidatus Aquilonibacter sp.]|nr:hypothetical protein [Candidatus Aquilonibacter sp.]